MPDLINYIQNLLRQGYPVSQIKDVLLRYGYPPDTVDHAIYQSMHQGEIRHTIHLSKTTLLAILLIAIGIVGVTFFLISGNDQKQPAALLDVSISSIKDTAKADGFLSASVELTNMGSNSRQDIYLKAEIIEEDSKRRLTFKSETIALETTKSHNFNIKIPSDADAGRYILQVTARYQSQSPKATEMFSIVSNSPSIEANCFDGIINQGETKVDCGGPCDPCEEDRDCPNNCDDGDPMTIDSCEEGNCIHERPSVCGDSVCSDGENENSCPDDCYTKRPADTDNNIWEELDSIKQLARSNPDKAKRRCNTLDAEYVDKCLQDVGMQSTDPNICDQIGDQMKKERCFSSVAKNMNKPAICENIEKESRKNSCYINFAVDGDYSVCEKITNEYLKKSCSTLQQTSR